MKKLLVFLAVAGRAAAADGAMPVAQQNELVQKYCAVCHTDAARNGGLSLEHFDAAHPDPGDAAMVVNKMKTGAFGAAGLKIPDREVQNELVSALAAKASGAAGWNVNRAVDPATKSAVVTASVVQEVAKAGGVPDLYRLKLSCRADMHEGEMQLSWSPGVPEDGRDVSVAVDGRAPVSYKIEGRETMGNGTGGGSGPGAILLNAATPLPAATLTIGNVFAGETVAFPFGGLARGVRDALSGCFGR